MPSLQKDIKFLPGVGPKRAELLNKELGIFTYKDLLYYFPYKYVDRSQFFKISEITAQMSHIQIKGKITNFQIQGAKYKQRLNATFSDETGSIELVWFKGIKWIQKSLKVGKHYVVFGKPILFGRQFSIAHPEVEPIESINTSHQGLHGQYSLTEKLKNGYINSKTIFKFQQNIFQEIDGKLDETLPEYIIGKNNLLSLNKALAYAHLPPNQQELKKALFRLKFEELFFIQLNILSQRIKLKREMKGFVFEKVGDYFNNFYKQNLKFELTGAQKRVMKEIRKDLGSGKHMNRLLQGDVGSGKTLVALMTMLIAIDNGYQTCLMAPTEILATQHYYTIVNFLEGLKLPVRLLTGSTKKAERTKIHEGLQNGEIKILIGTHALIEDQVNFKNLGLSIIDEQHRFGVVQRAKLWKKNTNPPHVLVMTATPIPRTLAMTLYGDLDVSVINELPPGRKPIKTSHHYDSKRLRMFGFIREQIAQGRQVYIVYPLIKESEKFDYKDLEDGFESISRAFPLPDYRVSVVHGKMKPEEKEAAMQEFKKGFTHILIATSVIEVGVDVPNANVIVIESAERFGLSQLHQLRGRVGRGQHQSYCILMTSYKLTNEARKRMETMVATNDGFEIAEADLKLRGPGDLEGTQQSGIAFDLKVSNIAKDGQIITFVRDLAENILEEDPQLENEKNILLRQYLQNEKRGKLDWSRIS